MKTGLESKAVSAKYFPLRYALHSEAEAARCEF
jgi:hypothetical protein